MHWKNAKKTSETSLGKRIKLAIFIKAACVPTIVCPLLPVPIPEHYAHWHLNSTNVLPSAYYHKKSSECFYMHYSLPATQYGWLTTVHVAGFHQMKSERLKHIGESGTANPLISRSSSFADCKNELYQNEFQLRYPILFFSMKVNESRMECEASVKVGLHSFFVSYKPKPSRHKASLFFNSFLLKFVRKADSHSFYLHSSIPWK